MKLFFIVGILFFTLVSQSQTVGMLGTNFAAPTIDDKDNVYNPMPGEIIFDTSDSTFYGRTQSTTWISLGGSNAILPAGSILTFAASTCPAGYLAADGSEVDRTTYAELFAVIGIAHGSGNGGSTFNLPDYRGRFLRGLDGTAGRDPDATRTAMAAGGNTGDAVGSVQGHQVQSHNHSYNNSVTPVSVQGGSNYVIQADNVSAVTSSTGGNETRPINAYVNYCIKY